MSDNLYLKGTRTVYTKSGRESSQEEQISLFQTPTAVTHEIASLPDFDKQLDRYCKWADSLEAEVGYREPEEWQWEEIYDTETRGKENYFKLNVPGWGDRDGKFFVERVVLRGEPEFDRIYKLKDTGLLFLYENADFKGVGFRLVRPHPHSKTVRIQVAKLQADEYEMEFYWL